MARRADYNAKYGSEPGVKFYTHVSDRYAPFHSKVIAANASEAAHICVSLGAFAGYAFARHGRSHFFAAIPWGRCC